MAISQRQLILIGVAVVGLFMAAAVNGGFGTASSAENDPIAGGSSDFEVGDLYDTDQTLAGENTTIWATLSNGGSETSTQPVTIRIDLDGDGVFDTTVAEEDVTLDPGQSETVAIPVPTTGLEPGTYTYGIFVGDSLESPVRTEEIAVLRPTTFMIDEINSEASVVQGDTATMTASITNRGDTQGAQTVEFGVTDEFGAAEPNATASKTVSIGPDETEQVTFSVSTADLEPGQYDYQVRTAADEASSSFAVDQPATFQVTNLTGPATTPRGDPVVLTGQVENTGDVAGTESVALMQDGETVDTTTVSLDGDESTSVNFTVEMTNHTRGNYTYSLESSVDSMDTTVRVIDSEFRVNRVRGNETLYIGDQMVFVATIENIGDMNDTQTVEWMVDLEGDDAPESYGITQELTLAGGEKADITFVIPYLEDPDPFIWYEDFPTGTFVYAVYTDDSSETDVFVARHPPTSGGSSDSDSGSSGSSDSDGDSSGSFEPATLDEIAIQKYGLYYDEISGETQDQLLEIYNRQPFASGLTVVDVKTREEIARQDYGLDVGRNDNFDFTAIDIETQQEIEADFDAQFLSDDGDRVESWDELAQAQYGSDYDDLTDEQQEGIRDDYLAQF